MRIFIIILLTCLFYSLTLLGAITAYRNDQEMKAYKTQVSAVQTHYHELQSAFQEYKQKTPQTVVLSNNIESKNAIIQDIINTYTANVDGDLSIYYKNLTTGETITINGDKKYYMASLYKVILTIYILDQIKNGKIQLTDLVGDPPITLDTALIKIITESNNEYAQALVQTFGWDAIQKAMEQKLNIDFSFNSDLQTDVKKMGALFEDIALSLKISDTESYYLLQLLNDQKKTSKLPKYLPKHIYSHNKTGEFDDYSHDAGIFYTPKANYILIFMSKTKYPSQTDEQMAIMSKNVYDTLNDITTIIATSSASPVSTASASLELATQVDPAVKQ